MDIDLEILHEIFQDLPRLGAGRDEYTQKAFEMIPEINQPKILDIGCGTGLQTIKLAKMSNGEVIGIDVFERYLDQFRESIKEEKLEKRVKAVNMSMTEIKYPEKHFDILWAEGSIFIIGFENGLIEWKKYIKDNGFLAIHDLAWIKDNPPKEVFDFFQRIYPGMKTMEEHLEMIKQSGYKILGYFPLPEDAWWEFFYKPLKKRLPGLKIRFKDNPKAMDMLADNELEIEMYEKYNQWYSSVFYIMQKQ